MRGLRGKFCVVPECRFQRCVHTERREQRRGPGAGADHHGIEPCGTGWCVHVDRIARGDQSLNLRALQVGAMRARSIGQCADNAQWIDHMRAVGEGERGTRRLPRRTHDRVERIARHGSSRNAPAVHLGDFRVRLALRVLAEPDLHVAVAPYQIRAADGAQHLLERGGCRSHERCQMVRVGVAAECGMREAPRPRRERPAPPQRDV